MIGRSSSFLGAAVSDGAITFAEVSVSGDRCTVRRTATFTFTAEESLEAPDAAGGALTAFLRQNGFTASRVVVGVPARWLIAVERELPPADEEQARAALRLLAERLAVAESGDMVFDFAGRADRSARTKVLLVGMPRQRLDRVTRMMDAAGMSIAAVSSTGLTLASGVASREPDAGVLMLGRGGGEIIFRDAGAPRMLRHVPVMVNGHPGGTALGPLAAELRRAVTLSPANPRNVERHLLLLDGVGLAEREIADLSRHLGVPVSAADGATMLCVTDERADAPEPRGQYAPAVSLALAAARPALLPVNFANSRLTPPRVKRFGRKGAWGIGAAAVVLIALIILMITNHQRQSELDALNAQLNKLKPDVAAAQSVIDRLTYTRGFFETRPSALECLREITQAFHDDERVWTTSFTFREVKVPTPGKGPGVDDKPVLSVLLSGKAADQKTIYAMLGRLKQNARFSDVKTIEVKEADSRSREWSYSASMVFSPVE